MLLELLNTKYKNIILKKLYFVSEEKLMKKINYKEKKLFKMLHKYFWKHNKNNAELNSKYRTEYKTNQLNNIIKDIKYNKNKYLDIGCEECIMPMSYGNLLGIKNINCVNIHNWESSYGLSKKNMNLCNFQYYDGINLPFDDTSISVISCEMVLHHIEKTKRNLLLDNMYRVLEKDGLIIIREHNLKGEKFDLFLDFIHRYYDSILLKKFLWIEKYDTHYMTFQELISEFKQHNFKLIKVNFFNKYDNSYIAIFRKLIK
jgi:ubiquinone/menaquinone biosynthesis C-methylase UbiE